MAKKRRSGGRSGGKRGNNTAEQCSNCGRMVPSDKIKKQTRYVSVVDPRMSKELREAGAILPRRKVTENFCVSCAIHYKKVKIRSSDSRKGPNRY
ncbi:30S ribosomal protein S26e [archaeon]|jgi:small subunit ribosomal protein S26e|nr:30S ribosomal protein S26e [Candidatus Heimdallarchaeota archaeon]MEC8704548.1 30S ribosomal protein S26e [Asgard group archaeon]NDB28189.1 30S ribosomal protein S26e [archaeon]NDB54445.1 30S ribosomal protein S26e [archaeon]NDB78396.1 30S ribosomal protein S26e [archaeon]|tara:strand:- start:7 stop:291 length:285 start_codon:yes stop_codon:yes gene_type:complete